MKHDTDAVSVTVSSRLSTSSSPRRPKRVYADKENYPDVTESEGKTKKKRRGGEGGNKKKKKRKHSKSSKRKETSLTSQAVESICAFSAARPKQNVSLETPLVVQLRVDPTQAHSGQSNLLVSQDKALWATIYDGVNTLPVLLLNDPNNGRLQADLQDTVTAIQDWVVRVHGLVVTEGFNPKFPLPPIVCITSMEILSTPPSTFPTKQSHYSIDPTKALLPLSPEPRSNPSTVPARVKAGSIGSFLQENIPFFTNDELTHCHNVPAQRALHQDTTDRESWEASVSETHRHMEELQAFLTRNTAMLTLQKSSDTTDHTVASYSNALKEFASSQLDRQKASLATNAGREAADRASLITDQHRAALEEALQDKEELTPQLLHKWHSTLLKDLHEDAGKIRTNKVRAGLTVFCRPKYIESELNKFCKSLSSLQQRLQWESNAWHAIFFAAVAMYGIIDIHPYADGNGRLCRIVANWALRHLPFTINLFATPAQRSEYVLALESTRHLLSLSKTSGQVSQEELLLVKKSSGPFAPMMALLADRISRAMVEFNRVWQEKSGLAAEAIKDKAARQARELAKEGQCIICLDDHPNIATLCCGKAIHLNCIAEWLSAKNSCPCCRSEMPSISGRVVRAATGVDTRIGSPNRRGLSIRPVVNGVDETARDVIVSLLNSFGNSTDTTTDDYDSSEENFDEDIDDEEDLDSDSESDSSDEYSTDDNDDEDDDDSHSEEDSPNDEGVALNPPVFLEMDSDSSPDVGENRRTSLDSEETFEDVGEEVPAENVEENNGESGENSNFREYCDALYCRNRPAVDCTNNLCGRCCVLGGQFHCPRHNS